MAFRKFIEVAPPQYDLNIPGAEDRGVGGEVRGRANWASGTDHGPIARSAPAAQTNAKGSCASNATEPMPPPYRVVLHGFQIKDIDDEIVAGVGTYPLGEGLTASVFKERFQGMIKGAQLYLDDNITIDASADAKGGVFAQYALLLIEGRAPWSFVKHEPQRGGGGNSLFLYDEYAWGERGGGVGVYEIYSDATTPTT